jgi:hypothetical protein
MNQGSVSNQFGDVFGNIHQILSSSFILKIKRPSGFAARGKITRMNMRCGALFAAMAGWPL